jgi:multidrug efflux pump
MVPTKGFLGWFNRFFARTTQRYKNGVTGVVRRGGRYLLLYAGLLGIMGWLFMTLPTSFLPEEDQGYFINLVQLPPGATRERSQEVLTQVEQFYLKQPEVEHVIGVLGFSFFGRGQNAAIAFVRLKDWDERPDKGSDASSLVKKANMTLFRIKQAFIFAINVPPIPELAAVGGFDFRLQDRSGQGRAKLLEARNMALGLASKHPALVGVRPEGQEPAPQLLIDIDRLKARALGIDIADLNETLQSSLGVAYINDFVRDGRILRVQMQAESGTRTTPERILQIPVRNAQGGMVTLSEFARVRWVVDLPKLDRFNGLPSMKLAGSPAPGRSSGDALKAMEEVASKLPPGFGYEWSGTSSEERLSGNQAPFLFGLSLVAVFLCLAALYESWAIPAAVLMVVPIGIFGALSAVTMRGLTNDIYFKVGLVVIIGLAAKNAILIIQFALDLQRRGHELVEATLEACRLRFRPILMTSIAFVLGVLPLVISHGAGANGRHALGTGVMGGMIAATLLAVFFIPVFFVTIRRLFPGGVRHHEQDKQE